jgi:hypothetical protein
MAKRNRHDYPSVPISGVNFPLAGRSQNFPGEMKAAIVLAQELASLKK